MKILVGYDKLKQSNGIGTLKGGFLIKITEEEQNKRKARIIHEAFKLFCEKGIDKVSIKEIAQKASVGEMSIYRYFSTKTALLIGTITMLWDEIIKELITTIIESREQYETMTGYEQIKQLLEGFRPLFENHASYILFSYDYKLYLIRQSSFLSEEVYLDELEPVRELFISALMKGKEDGSISISQTPEDVYLTIWGLMRGYVAKVCIFDSMYAGNNLWRHHFDLACNMILGGLKSGAC